MMAHRNKRKGENRGANNSPFLLEGEMVSTPRGNAKNGCQAVTDCQSNKIVSGNEEQETTEDVALLLTSMTEIASKEVPTSACKTLPPPTDGVPRYAGSFGCWDASEYSPEKKARTISISSPGLVAQRSPEYGVGNYTFGESPSVTPPLTPPLVSMRPRAISTSSIDDRIYDGSPRVAYSKQILQPQIGRRSKRPVGRVLHKKFSWKNYPELEEFLIANREEYLRHSTLNYTVQQKQYNNKLTERMLELAAEHGYVFDEHDFSFVTVRDRIRCYYKSYVQSLKKRGVIIGYAARKAGLVTDTDLEQSACVKSKIYMPHHHPMAS